MVSDTGSVLVSAVAVDSAVKLEEFVHFCYTILSLTLLSLPPTQSFCGANSRGAEGIDHSVTLSRHLPATVVCWSHPDCYQKIIPDLKAHIQI